MAAVELFVFIFFHIHHLRMSKQIISPQTLTEKTKARNEIENLMARMNLEEGKVEIPKRKAPGVAGRKNVIDTNVYQVQIADKWVYRYDVTVMGTSSRGKDVDLTKRSESTAVIADRIGICRHVFRIILEQYKAIFKNSTVYYDLQSILFTLEPIDFPTNKDQIHLIVEQNERVQLPGNLQSVTLELKQVKESAQKIKLNDLETLIDPETMKRDRSVLGFIELAVNQYPMFSEKEFLTLKGSTAYFMDGQAHGLPEKNLDRGGSKYLASGVQKSAMLIEGFKNQNSAQDQRVVALMLEAKHSPFHSVLKLMDVIRQHDRTQPIAQRFANGQCNENDLKTLNRTFKKLLFDVYYPGEHRSFRRIELKHFDKTTANTNIIVERNETVAQYFAGKYGVLEFPNAHLVAVKRGSIWSYYPPELLRVADNQAVTVEQMDASSKAAMIRECAIRPDVMRVENENAAQAIKLHSSKHTSEAGIKFSKATLSVESRVLMPPRMHYANGPADTVRGEAAWRMSKFVNPSVKKTGFCLYQLRTQCSPAFSDEQLKAFISQLVETAKKMGMDLGECVDFGTYYEDEVISCIRYSAENNIHLCYFISPENITRQHAVMKMCEHRYNVVTQDVKVGTVRKMMNRGTATLENYVAKTNLKLGGLNYEVKDRNPEVQHELENSLFIGINTNQPGSKSVTDRVKSIKDEKPGVLGFSANMVENYNTFIGDFVYTVAYRSEFYAQLQSIFKRCVSTFAAKRGKMPEKVVFYYTGLTEGQFENAYKLAIPMIKKGIRDANNDGDISLILMAVHKYNNVRLFPKTFPKNDAKDYEYNVPFGTTVDKTINHSLFSEFYQMSHSALKGTGRVPRYTILLDESNSSMDLIEGFTNALAFEHQIVSRATSLPTPVFVAEGYAQRGRDVFDAAYGTQQTHDEAIPPLPRDADNQVDFVHLSSNLNYENTSLEFQRVNA
ncbi:hypothetical protein M3Y98_00027400 [Aphelenchoides besseyi]|nr:hypothetical protein M3Y98_00027400 [Aphelenchoides besseyi]KAI6199314.1 hypothetical protein M3Y96_00613700 [Aphelenchoides besseyi]